MLTKFVNLDYNQQISKNIKELNYQITHFPCGEYEFSIFENIQEIDINIYQTFSVKNFNNDLMKLYVVCSVLNKNNVSNINYFASFLPYTRQDKNCNISSCGVKFLATLLNYCKIKKLVTYDLHSNEIKKYFNGKIENISAILIFLNDIQAQFDIEKIAIIFPDEGAHSRFNKYFDKKKYKIYVINKTRIKGKIKMKFKTKILATTAIIIDDIIDTGNTIIETTKILKNNNITNIFVYATHGIFSKNAITKLTKIKEIQKITITNSLKQDKKLTSKFNIIEL